MRNHETEPVTVKIDDGTFGASQVFKDEWQTRKQAKQDWDDTTPTTRRTQMVEHSASDPRVNVMPGDGRRLFVHILSRHGGRIIGRI